MSTPDLNLLVTLDVLLAGCLSPLVLAGLRSESGTPLRSASLVAAVVLILLATWSLALRRHHPVAVLSAVVAAALAVTTPAPPTGPGKNVLPYIKAFVNVPFFSRNEEPGKNTCALRNSAMSDDWHRNAGVSVNVEGAI